MTMTRQAYETLVRRLEARARAHPLLYRLQAFLLVAVGVLAIPAVLCFSLLLCLLACLTIVSGSFGLYLIALALRNLIGQSIAAIKALRFVVYPPAGIEISRSEAPALFTLVDEMCARLKAPRIHHILLTSECNASLAQVPRLGPFGWQVNYLLLGLPLLQGFSPEHFKAVLAHELGHLAGSHAHFGLWFIRVHQTWMRFTEELEQNPRVKFGMNQFFRWYVPLLEPYYFILSRLDEIDADRMAGEVVGRLTNARMYIRLTLLVSFINQYYWPEVKQRSEDEPTPPKTMITDLMARVRDGISPEQETEILAEAFERATGMFVPHLAFCERLTSMGFPSVFNEGGPKLHTDLRRIPPPEVTAADTYLGERLPHYVAQFDQAIWLRAVRGWNESYVAVQESRERLQEIADTRDVPPNADEAFEHAALALRAQGVDVALPLLQQVLALQANHGPANFLLGQLLLDQGNDTGIRHLRLVMEQHPEMALQACGVVYDYLVHTGNAAKADEYAAWGRQFSVTLQRAEEERSNVNERTALSPHEWTEDELAVLRMQLAQVPGVAQAFLARRVVQLLPGRPCFILGIIPDARRVRGKDAVMRVLTQVYQEVSPSRETFIVPLAGMLPSVFEERLKGMAGAYVYQQPSAQEAAR